MQGFLRGVDAMLDWEFVFVCVCTFVCVLNVYVYLCAGVLHV